MAGVDLVVQAMRCVQNWAPTKFERNGEEWRGSRNPKFLAVSSRIAADLAIKAIAALVRQYARGHLLDLGCGTAPLYGIYRDHVDQITCVDWKSSLHSTRHIDCFVDLNNVLPLDDDQIDTILCTDVLEHIADPGKLSGEMARILAPGGRLVASIPFLYPLHEVPHDYFRFTEFKLRQFCEEAGLQVLELKAYGGLLDVLSVLTAKLLARYGLLCVGFTALCGFMLELSPARSLRRRTAKTYPLGYCLVAEKRDATT